MFVLFVLETFTLYTRHHIFIQHSTHDFLQYYKKMSNSSSSYSSSSCTPMTHQTESNLVLWYMNGSSLDNDTRRKLKAGFTQQLTNRVPLYGKALLDIVKLIHRKEVPVDVRELNIMTEELIRYHPQLLCHRLLCTYLVPLVLFHHDAQFELGTHFLSLLLLAYQSLVQHDRHLCNHWASMCRDRLFAEEDRVHVLLHGSAMNIFCPHGHLCFLGELLLTYAKEATACAQDGKMQKILRWWLGFHCQEKIDGQELARWWWSGLYPELLQDVDYWYRRLQYSGPNLDHLFSHHLSLYPMFAPLMQRILDHDGWTCDYNVLPVKVGSLTCRRKVVVEAMDRDDVTLLPSLLSLAFLNDTKLRSVDVRKTLVLLQQKATDHVRKRLLCATLESMRLEERFAKIQQDLVFQKGDALYRYLLRQTLMVVPWYGVSTSRLLCPGVFGKHQMPQEVLRLIFSFL